MSNAFGPDIHEILEFPHERLSHKQLREEVQAATDFLNGLEFDYDPANDTHWAVKVKRKEMVDEQSFRWQCARLGAGYVRGDR